MRETFIRIDAVETHGSLGHPTLTRRVPLLQCEIFVPNTARCRGGRHKFHVRLNLHIAKSTDRSIRSRKEICPAQSHQKKSWRSWRVAAFCFLSCGRSSNLPLRSGQHTIVNASAVLRATEKNQKFCSQAKLRGKIGEKSYPRASRNLSRPWLSVFENAAVRWRATSLIQCIPTR